MKILNAKIREKDSKGPACYEYKNEVLFSDYKKLAIFLFDLSNYGGNIEKAFEEYKNLKNNDFPW